LNGLEEIRLATTVATNDYVVIGTEGLDDGLLAVRTKALYNHLFYVHLLVSKKELKKNGKKYKLKEI